MDYRRKVAGPPAIAGAGSPSDFAGKSPDLRRTSPKGCWTTIGHRRMVAGPTSDFAGSRQTSATGHWTAISLYIYSLIIKVKDKFV